MMTSIEEQGDPDTKGGRSVFVIETSVQGIRQLQTDED
jgi:hypothetical protein